MAATREDIRGWFERGVAQDATDMVIICDTFDYEDYPCYFEDAEQARIKASQPGSMQRVMETYDLTGDMKEQLDLHRCNRFSDDPITVGDCDT